MDKTKYIKKEDVIRLIIETGREKSINANNRSDVSTIARFVADIVWNISEMPSLENMDKNDVVKSEIAYWNREDDLFICSNCNQVAPYYVENGIIKYWPDLKYCPKCGCKMNEIEGWNEQK